MYIYEGDERTMENIVWMTAKELIGIYEFPFYVRKKRYRNPDCYYKIEGVKGNNILGNLYIGDEIQYQADGSRYEICMGDLCCVYDKKRNKKRYIYNLAERD